MDPADKLKIMDRLKAAGLWGVAREYLEQVRQRLRTEGKTTKREAVVAAWDETVAKYMPLAGQATPAFARAYPAATEAQLAEPLAPIDLDENYCEKDFASTFRDSVVWVAFECRRVKVQYGPGYKVDYSRASRKPPTAMAMDMVEYYVAHPEKLDRLYQQAMRLAIKGGVKPALAKPAMAKMLPKSQDELDADNYLRSIGALPPEEQEGKET